MAGWRPARRPSRGPAVDCLFPCFYGGGGSCAFDRRKFLELGGFDELLAPFYLEDTDLGFLAWKRGWKVLYQPASVVYHEHRGTIGKRFRNDYIQSVLQKNFLLFCWKNIHELDAAGRRISFFAWAGAVDDGLFRRFAGAGQRRGYLRAFLSTSGRYEVALERPVARRWTIPKPFAARSPPGFTTASRRLPRPVRPRVLFVSPYPICPPTHGGGFSC